MDEKPKHGQVRNWREETRVEFQDYTANGRPFRAICFAETESVSERYCSACGQWSEVKGVIGVMLGCPHCGMDW